MNETVLVAIIAGGFGLFGTITALVSAVYTVRASSKAQKQNADIEKAKVDAAAFDRAKNYLDDTVDRLEKEQARLQDRVDMLEQTSANQKNLLERWITYSRKLAEMLREQGIEPPEPPPAQHIEPSRPPEHQRNV